ncbi:hypothetical protein BCF53_1212 [Reinekea marinisedimentorum]|uniref:Uncharacterized protein n=1 Tax=Reinekea marinisedimentorum TaxID=230495 RepID=A0A4R3HWD1_9GAMM|nr:hypothetical protein BCF53_1212 [Reinekea marinisedimentorum]
MENNYRCRTSNLILRGSRAIGKNVTAYFSQIRSTKGGNKLLPTAIQLNATAALRYSVIQRGMVKFLGYWAKQTVT